MISAEADDLGPVLGVQTLDWDDGGGSRRIAQPGGTARRLRSPSASLEADAQASGRIWRGTPLKPSGQRDVNVLLQSWD